MVGVQGLNGLWRAIQTVWASLWSDAAILYRAELGLDPRESAMAVVLQQLVSAEVSGVAFAVAPQSTDSSQALVEAVPGLCQQLVDGHLDPDQYWLDRKTKKLIRFRRGENALGGSTKPLLTDKDLQAQIN